MAANTFFYVTEERVAGTRPYHILRLMAANTGYGHKNDPVMLTLKGHDLPSLWEDMGFFMRDQPGARIARDLQEYAAMCAVRDEAQPGKEGP